MTVTDLERDVREAVGDEAPGVTLVIVGTEGVRARSAIGTADHRSGIRMSTELAAPWFSMTKIATATTVVRLSESGAMDLDEPLARKVPAMGRLTPAAWRETITARHLLQHSAGLANPIPIRWIHPADAPGPDPNGFLEGLLAKRGKLRFEPGARSSYSNLSSLILGAAISAATGKRFETVVEQEVLTPLGMTATAFGYPAGIPSATGHHPKMSPARFLLPGWVRGESSGRWLTLRPFLVDGAPYGGLVGTAEDAARFLRLHLGEGLLDDTRSISAVGARRMRDITVRGKTYDLGLGWFVPSSERDADPPFVQHLGGGAGFWNVMRMYPTLGVGAVVMGNSTKYDADAVARLALAFR